MRTILRNIQISTRKNFDKEEYERKKKLAGYGLVIVKKKDENETAASAPKNPYQSISVLPAPVTNKVPVKRKPMTQEEKEARLHEMQENAKWRETERLKNVKATKAIEKLEEEEEKQSTVPTFLRAQIVAASEQSLENRIQSNKRSVQRSYGYMEKKFSSR
ncbi:unnamed protein product [Auanema sp. JU1783]|nr:unnamed protein product [Auanema sp. JU1783]